MEDPNEVEAEVFTSHIDLQQKVSFLLLWDRRFNPQATACDQSSSMGMQVMMRSDTQSPSTSISSSTMRAVSGRLSRKPRVI